MKNCVQCGLPLARRHNESPTQFAGRLYCNKLCQRQVPYQERTCRWPGCGALAVAEFPGVGGEPYRVCGVHEALMEVPA